MTVNSFNAGKGNVVFPGAEWFYDLLAQGRQSGVGDQTTVTNTNNATVNNTVSAEADSGDNTAEGENSEIQTGNTSAGVNVVNQVNTNIFGNSLSFLFRIHGSWAGEIFGLPEGMNWRETSEGVEIFFGEGGTASAPAGSTDNLTVSNTNNATVNNNVSVFALTGDNKAETENGDATVTTGDASASANVVNVVNSNVLGRNWVLAVFNIFGDWNGNIAFGQPDLWVGARAIAPEKIYKGTCFEYEVTVNNLGDSDATDVSLKGIYSDLQQQINGFKADAQGTMSYNMGRISAGDSSVVTFPVCLSTYLADGTSVMTEFVASSNEDDADEANNHETIGVTTATRVGGSALRLGSAEITIDKTVDRKKIRASSSVTYEITIKNTGDPVYNALLIDTIIDANEKPIHEQRWGLGTILANETITVSYDAFFNGSTTPGMYTNKAFISGTEHHPDYKTHLGSPLDSPVAQVAIEVVADEPEEEKVCTPLLTSYIGYERDNDSKEVGELQFFLKTMEDFSQVEITNVYDRVTYDAVHAFQQRYAKDILEPWGMTQTSGYVYYTTQKKINELWCKDLDFSLSDTQKKEIEAFKDRTRNYIERHVEVPEEEFQNFGYNAPTEEESEEAEKIAMATEPVLVQYEKKDEVTQDQVAAATEALGGKAIQSLWSTIRNGIKDAFSVLTF